MALFKSLTLSALLTCALASSSVQTVTGNLVYKEKWGYTVVRPHANLFWWLYYVEATDEQESKARPLLLWLQLQRADLIFVDQPVGTGFSYTTDDAAFTNNVQEIAADLLEWAKQWFGAHSRFRSRPFFITCESYGGKMTAVFATVLYQAIGRGEIQMDFRGVAMGDSWISPIDYLNSYGPYLFSASLLSARGMQQVSVQAHHCQDLIDHDKWDEAFTCWKENQVLIGEVTDGVSWYNYLKRSQSDPWSARSQTAQERLYEMQVRDVYYQGYSGTLSELMNGPIRKKLRIIPKGVTWGGQVAKVTEHNAADFMKPVIDYVDYLLENTTLQVNIYSGQLDVICNVLGTEMWMQNLQWSHLPDYRKAPRVAFHAGPGALYQQTAGFYQEYGNFTFYWIMRAGHMVPSDAPYAALKMIDMIVS